MAAERGDGCNCKEGAGKTGYRRELTSGEGGGGVGQRSEWKRAETEWMQ